MYLPSSSIIQKQIIWQWEKEKKDWPQNYGRKRQPVLIWRGFMLTFESKRTQFAWFWSIHFVAKQKQDRRSLIHQGKSIRRIGDCIGHNFKPWRYIHSQSFALKFWWTHLKDFVFTLTGVTSTTCDSRLCLPVISSPICANSSGEYLNN